MIRNVSVVCLLIIAGSLVGVLWPVTISDSLQCCTHALAPVRCASFDYTATHSVYIHEASDSSRRWLIEAKCIILRRGQVLCVPGGSVQQMKRIRVNWCFADYSANLYYGDVLELYQCGSTTTQHRNSWTNRAKMASHTETSGWRHEYCPTPCHWTFGH